MSSFFTTIGTIATSGCKIKRGKLMKINIKKVFICIISILIFTGMIIFLKGVVEKGRNYKDIFEHTGVVKDPGVIPLSKLISDLTVQLGIISIAITVIILVALAVEYFLVPSDKKEIIKKSAFLKIIFALFFVGLTIFFLLV